MRLQPSLNQKIFALMSMTNDIMANMNTIVMISHAIITGLERFTLSSFD